MTLVRLRFANFVLTPESHQWAWLVKHRLLPTCYCYCTMPLLGRNWFFSDATRRLSSFMFIISLFSRYIYIYNMSHQNLIRSVDCVFGRFCWGDHRSTTIGVCWLCFVSWTELTLEMRTENTEIDANSKLIFLWVNNISPEPHPTACNDHKTCRAPSGEFRSLTQILLTIYITSSLDSHTRT